MTVSCPRKPVPARTSALSQMQVSNSRKRTLNSCTGSGKLWGALPRGADLKDSSRMLSVIALQGSECSWVQHGL